jgi:nucleotide-binding universal stress UspA family protein
MYDDVLIPTDGSDPAERAARYGVALADSYGAAIHAVSVVDERDFSAGILDGEDLIREGQESADEEATRAVEFVGNLAPEAAVTTHVEIGVPAAAILEYVSRAGIDAVVMGTHGRTGIERFVIGSVTERVVRLADVPVLSVRPTEITPTWPPVDRVLFPTDGSDAAASALPYAIDLAERFGAVLEVLYVIDERTKSSYYNIQTALEDVTGGLQTAAERATDRVEEEATERGVTVETTIVGGLPSETICERAEDPGADIVVMATHGRTGLGHALLGSVTERVVRNSPTPVLTTPVSDRETGQGD